jgi:hypothetical protein
VRQVLVVRAKTDKSLRKLLEKEAAANTINKNAKLALERKKSVRRMGKK